MPDEPTTPDLVELSRRLNEAVNRDDFEAALAMYTPYAVWDVGSTRFVESPMASVATWANGLIEWTTTYPDIDEGRAAAERLAEERG
jgi:hypothetical protein